MEERTTEDIDGLAEFITVQQRHAPASVCLPEPEPQPAPEPAPAQRPAALVPNPVDVEAAVAAAAGALRRFVLGNGAIAPTADSSEIEDALRQLSSASRSAAGRQAAVQAGVVDRCISLMVALARQVADAPIVPDQAVPVDPSLPLVLRCIRNLCAGSRTTQEQLWEREAPAAALTLARHLVEPLHSGVPAWLIGSSAEAVECACLAVQLIGNSAAAHEQMSTEAWKLLFPDGFLALLRVPLRAGIRKSPLPSLVSCVAMVVQTCLAKSAHCIAHRDELACSAAGAALVVQLMQHLVDANKDAMLVEDDQSGGTRTQRQNDQEQIDPQAYHWIGLIVEGQCASEHAESTFESLGGIIAAQAKPEPEQGVAQLDRTVTWDTLANPAQLRWLEVVSAGLTAAAAAQPNGQARHAAFSTADFLVNRLLPAALLDDPADAEGLFAPTTPVSALEAVYVAVHTLGVLLAVYTNEGNETQQGENGWRLLSDKRLVQLASRATVLLSVSGPPPKPPSETTAGTEKGKILPRGFKSQLLKLIGNAAFRHRGAQDAIHAHGGTAIAAAHTMVDEHNPYSREWVGIIALENLAPRAIQLHMQRCRM